jgi:hypothetical protein
MKFVHPVQQRLAKLRRALFLRYGEEEPSLNPKPTPLLPLSAVAKMMSLTVS